MKRGSRSPTGEAAYAGQSSSGEIRPVRNLAGEALPFSATCKLCPRLASHLDTIRVGYPGYHAAPVAPFGDPSARLLIVGLAPGLHGANRTGRPFTGDYAGILLYETLHDLGLASQPVASSMGDGMRLNGCRITNAVKCLPPRNQPQSDEVNRCNPYLRFELGVLGHGLAILALGRIAHSAILKALSLRAASYPFAHGARHRLPHSYTVYDSYHCSRYNLQTRRLSRAMFRAVLGAIARDLAESPRR